MKNILMSLGLLTALLVGGAVSMVAAGGCCDQVKCCSGACHCPCCQK
jgi:hypothetical protein